MKELNYMKGQLELMSKKEVVDVYYKFLKANNKKVLKQDLIGFKKEYLIERFIKERNRKLIFNN